jgi:hypothetical protein
MAKTRKLIGKNTLTAIYEDYSRGVPIRTIKRRYDVKLHHTTFKNLLDTFALALKGDENAEHSLFPDWLSPHAHIVTAPVSCQYLGIWPAGFWVTGSITKEHIAKLG